MVETLAKDLEQYRFSATTLSITTLSIMTLHDDIHHNTIAQNDIQHTTTQHSDIIMAPSITTEQRIRISTFYPKKSFLIFSNFSTNPRSCLIKLF